MKTLPRLDDGSLAAYAWPGGYPIYYICEDSCYIFIVCTDCANKIEKESEDNIRVMEASINFEDDSLHCEECGAQIECAYC